MLLLLLFSFEMLHFVLLTKKLAVSVSGVVVVVDGLVHEALLVSVVSSSLLSNLT